MNKTILIALFGESGSGKTYALKNFDSEEIGIFSVEKNKPPAKFYD